MTKGGLFEPPFVLPASGKCVAYGMMKMFQHPYSYYTLVIALLFVSCSDTKDKTDEIPLFAPPARYPHFSGERALSLIHQQVAFGPRVPGTASHDSCRNFYVSYFTELGFEVEQQRFTLAGYDNTPLPMTNIIARVNPTSKRRILLAAHWDTRPWADMDPDPEARTIPIPGANDGGSGVAVLMEAARHFSASPPDVGVDIVFFDGEDYGRDGDESMFCLGSKYFAAAYSGERPLFGIILDLVGDIDAEFPREQFSRAYAMDIQNLVWGAAENLGLQRFVNRQHGAILDDHVSLNKVAGIKTIDIIDATLIGHDDRNARRQYWHTLNDTPEQCSAMTLGEVGRLVLYITYGINGDSK